MSEIDKQPKMFAKIIQIAFRPNDSSLYALDDNGVIYRRVSVDPEIRWVRCTLPEDV